ncbi:hypothetical protein BH23VER1_BH23VER1_01150 [soil metagenome]
MKRGPSEQHVIRRVQAADRLFQQQRGRTWLLRGVAGLVGVLVLCFALDVILHLGNGARLVLLLSAFGGGLAYLIFCAVVAFAKTNPLERTARLLEERDATLGSKIINLLQLREKADAEDLPPLTRQLAGRAIEDAASGLSGADFPALTREPDRRRRELWMAATPVILFVVACLLFPGLSSTEWARFLDPLGDVPPYSMTRLEIATPGEEGAEIAYKGSVLVEVTSSGHQPDEVFLSAHPPGMPAEVTTVPTFGRGDLGFVQDLENITTDLVVFAHTADGRSVSRKRNITVLLTPQIESAFVTVTPPPYTGRTADQKPFAFKNVRALAGSEIGFRIRSNRPLGRGTLTLHGAGGGITEVTLKPDPEVPEEVVGSLVATQSARAAFEIREVTGIAHDGDLHGSLTVTEDLPPKIAITNPPADTFVVQGFRTEVVIEASDDYGLAQIRVLRALNGLYSTPQSVRYDEVTRGEKIVLPLDLATLGVRSGDVISVAAEALDTAPDPQLARSKTIHLAVISEDDYNDFLRERRDAKDMENKYAALFSELNSLVEKQRELADAFAALEAELAANPPTTAEEQAAAAEALAALEERQRQLNEDLGQAADHFENFVRDNPLYDFENDIADSLAEFAAELRESAEQNEGDLGQAGSGQSPPAPGQLASDMRQAAQDQLERLGGTQNQAQEDVMEPLEDIAALHEIVKSFNHFSDLYALQQGVTEQARAFAGGRELSADDRRSLQQLAGTEQGLGSSLEALETKLKNDAEGAREKFPKAARSAEDLAHAIGANRMAGLANRASSVMVQGRGESSYQNAENLRQEMEKLLGEAQQAQQGEGGMAGELDQYYRLTRGGGAGQSFAQMMMSRRFRPGDLSLNPGESGASGSGMSGFNSSTQSSAPNMNVMGGESEIASPGAAGQTPEDSRGDGTPGTTDPATIDRTDSIARTSPEGEGSAPVDGSRLIEQYRPIVEQYFRRLTAPE